MDFVSTAEIRCQRIIEGDWDIDCGTKRYNGRVFCCAQFPIVSLIILHPLRLLTHDKTVDYFEYLAAIRTNPIARKVKLADLEDNLNILRLPAQMSDKDWQRLQKYRRAWEFLTQHS